MPKRERQASGWRALPVMTLAAAALLAGVSAPVAQQTCQARMEQDPALNNLVHPDGYRTAEPRTLGRVARMGEGPVDMVLIAGAGFGAEVFDGFMKANAAKYRMLAVTLPGFGGTSAPPMPPDETSYGELTWTGGAQEAIASLIEQEELDRPVVVGHWLSATTIALGLAVERPDLVRGAIVISGVPRFVPMSGMGMAEPSSVAQRVAMVDQYLAPNWFKTVTRVTWDDGNFMPRDYAIHPLRAQQLWVEAASPTMPVWIRYLCEAWAQDSTVGLDGLQVPVLILKPGFDDLYYQGPQMGDYMEGFLHRGWTGVEQLSTRIQVEMIEDSRVFIMDDQPAKLDASVERFVNGAAALARAVAVKRPAVAPAPYVTFSRFTDPGPQSAMLEVLPAEPVAIAAVAKNLTVHSNLLSYFDVPREEWAEVQSVWPPKAPDALSVLSESGPGDLLGPRTIKQRLRGACMSESHLLATMLRYRQIPVRIRAGYFRDVYTNEEHLVAFWEKNAREKGIAKELLQEDPVRWREVNHEYTRQQVKVNKGVEHWAAEYWDEKLQTWRLLDANNTFLKAMSDLDVDFHLPRRHFEYAHEAWHKMKAGKDFNPDQYAEWPQDGRSHIRSQLLWDFYSLLNHDIAGYDKTAWPDGEGTNAEREAYAFVKETRFEDVSAQEIVELDALAQLLSNDPGVEALAAFYRDSHHLRIATLDADPYSFTARQPAPVTP